MNAPRLALGRFATILALSAAAAAGEPVTLFRLSAVKLHPGPFHHAQDVLRTYLLAHDVDRFLAPYRIEANLEPKAPRYPNWESSGLDGHSAGHYLTALAQFSAATADPEMVRRLQTMVTELAEIQQANGDGYVGGVPGGRKMWAEIARGSFQADAFGLNGGWVPWYNLHKIFAGLRDAWLMAGNEQARAVFIALCDWCDRFAAQLSDNQMQAMLRTEHGGMNEVLADAFAITGNPKYLALAQRFSHRAILDPLLVREDKLTGLHANTQIPKVVGFERISALGGPGEWHEAARFFWETLVQNRSVAIGGNSVREHFHPADDFSSMLESREGPETCNTYNLLRLTEQLFQREPMARYADYYERALYNHILSSQHPEHGGFVYFTPMRPRDYRVYSQPGQAFWCCVGTGMENHGKYGRFIYAHTDEDLFVNLFIPSEVTWAAQGLSLRQETTFPHEPRSRLTLTLAKPRRFSLYLRYPGWVEKGALTLRINGRAGRVDATPSSYLALTREWQTGDTVDLELPMRTTTESLPDGSPAVAVLHGPIVLAARSGTENLDGLLAGDGRMAHVSPGPLLPLEGAPMLVGDPATFADHVRAVPGLPLTFTMADVIQPAHYAALRLEPFFRIHDARHVIYWRTATTEAYPGIVRELESRERVRAELQARTLDEVTPGQQQPEVEHQYRGDQSTIGSNRGRSWRSATGWFSYELRGTPGEPLALMVTYWEGEWGTRHFDLLANDQAVAEVTLTGKTTERFLDETYPLPPNAIGADGLVRVKFQAREKSAAGAVYGVRLVRVK